MHFPVALSLLVVSASTIITAAPSDSTFTSGPGLRRPSSAPKQDDCWFTLEAYDQSEAQANFTTVRQSDDGTLLLGGGSPVGNFRRKEHSSIPLFPSKTLWDDKGRKCHDKGGDGKQLTCNEKEHGDREYVIRKTVVKNGTSEWNVPILVRNHAKGDHFFDCPVPGVPGVRKIFEKSNHFLCRPIVLVPRPREGSTCACKRLKIFEPTRKTQQVSV